MSVRIANVASELEALPFAEQYCKARDSRAHFNRMEMVNYHRIAVRSALFDCIADPE